MFELNYKSSDAAKKPNNPAKFANLVAHNPLKHSPSQNVSKYFYVGT